MATKIIVIPGIWGFKCADSEGDDRKNELNFGQEYMSTLTQPRNLKYHRRFFVLLQMVFDNIPEGKYWELDNGQRIKIRTVKELRWHLAIQMGEYITKYTLGGRISYEVKSISFAKMDQSGFERYVSKAVDTILKVFIEADRNDLMMVVAMDF